MTSNVDLVRASETVGRLRDRIEQLVRELAAERALADRFGLAMQVSNSELQAALLAWRKARGL